MYLRKTKRKSKNGDTIEYFQLARNLRHPKTKQSIPKIIHSFGPKDKLKRDELARLCRSIARVCGLTLYDPFAENEELNREPHQPFASLHQDREDETAIALFQPHHSGRQENEEKFRTIFENASDLIAYIDVDGTVLDVNNKVEEIFGYPREKSIGKNINDLTQFIPKEKLDQFNLLIDSIRKVPLDRVEIKASHLDGTPVFTETTTRVVEKDGTIKGYISIVRDITHRKLMEQALRESEEMARALLNATTDAVMLIDREGCIRDLNKAYADQFHQPKDELKGAYLRELIPVDIPDLPETIASVFCTGVSMRFEKEYFGVWMDNVLYPVLDSNGSVSHVAIFSQNITKRKQAEQGLKEHRDHLETLVKERTSSLEDANTALKVLIEKKDDASEEMEKRIVSNIKWLICPALERLSKTRLSSIQKRHMEVVETNLNDILSAFTQKLSVQFLNFTVNEIQIASLIMQGKTNKEIAEMVNLSVKTVEFHRGKIRKKMNIKSRKQNLRSQLLALQYS